MTLPDDVLWGVYAWLDANTSIDWIRALSITPVANPRIKHGVTRGTAEEWEAFGLLPAWNAPTSQWKRVWWEPSRFPRLITHVREVYIPTMRWLSGHTWDRTARRVRVTRYEIPECPSAWTHLSIHTTASTLLIRHHPCLTYLQIEPKGKVHLYMCPPTRLRTLHILENARVMMHEHSTFGFEHVTQLTCSGFVHCAFDGDVFPAILHVPRLQTLTVCSASKLKQIHTPLPRLTHLRVGHTDAAFWDLLAGAFPAITHLCLTDSFLPHLPPLPSTITHLYLAVGSEELETCAFGRRAPHVFLLWRDGPRKFCPDTHTYRPIPCAADLPWS
jgi:hypothetical protein